MDERVNDTGQEKTENLFLSGYMTKIFRGLGYAGVIAIAAGTLFYAFRGLDTGSFNLREQSRIISAREQERERKENHRLDLLNRLFAPMGLADKDLNGEIGYDEYVDAYGKMGFTTPWPSNWRGFRHQLVIFPEPNVQQLEGAVENYEGKYGLGRIEIEERKKLWTPETHKEWEKLGRRLSETETGLRLLDSPLGERFLEEGGK